MSLANYGRACMLSSHDPLPFIRLIVSQNQAVWARAAGTDWVKSAVDVSSSALYRLTIRIRSDDTIRTTEYEYTIRTTIRHRSEYEANIRYIPTAQALHNLLAFVTQFSASEMTYIVSGGALNSTHSITHVSKQKCQVSSLLHWVRLRTCK